MQNLQVAAQKRLLSLIERVERLNEQRADLGADISGIFKEAKGEGFDVAILRKVIALRKLGKAEFLEQQALLDVYLAACSWTSTPLGAQSDAEGPRLVASNG